MRVRPGLLGAVLLAGCAVGSAQAQRAGARVALVIGNAAYESEDIGGLENPVRDAERVAEALAAAGFEVETELDLKERPFHHALGAFAEKSRQAATAAFYYAGHGLEQGGVNYLIPVDMEQPKDFDHDAVKLDKVIGSMQGERNLVFLDACRTLPGRGLRGASDSLLSRGLVAVSTKKGQQVVISYAAAKGKPALDGEAGGNSPYAAALAAHLVTPGQRLVDLLIEVENTVLEATDGQQEPWPSGSLGEKFYFVPPEPDVIVVNPTEVGGPVEGPVVVDPPPPPVVPPWERDWKRLEKNPASATVRAYITKYRGVDGAEVWVTDAEVLLTNLTKRPPPSPPPDPPRRAAGTPWKSPQGMEFVWIPAGRFVMGSPEGEQGRDEDEVQHEVRISSGFWMGKYAVTQGEWEVVMGKPKGYGFCPRCPVKELKWDEVQEFIQTLNEQSARSEYVYRLPTEAEWEYAARAGTTGPRYGELPKIAYWGLLDGLGYSRDDPFRVGQKRANSWGLHDMLGNTYEWVGDWYGEYPSGSVVDPTGPSTGSHRVIRGGAVYSNWKYVRSASRGSRRPDARRDNIVIGFRLVRTE